MNLIRAHTLSILWTDPARATIILMGDNFFSLEPSLFDKPDQRDCTKRTRPAAASESGTAAPNEPTLARNEANPAAQNEASFAESNGFPNRSDYADTTIDVEVAPNEANPAQWTAQNEASFAESDDQDDCPDRAAIIGDVGVTPNEARSPRRTKPQLS